MWRIGCAGAHRRSRRAIQRFGFSRFHVRRCAQALPSATFRVVAGFLRFATCSRAAQRSHLMLPALLLLLPPALLVGRVLRPGLALLLRHALQRRHAVGARHRRGRAATPVVARREQGVRRQRLKRSMPIRGRALARRPLPVPGGRARARRRAAPTAVERMAGPLLLVRPRCPRADSPRSGGEALAHPSPHSDVHAVWQSFFLELTFFRTMARKLFRDRAQTRCACACCCACVARTLRVRQLTPSNTI
jgi:hypothetical protein